MSKENGGPRTKNDARDPCAICGWGRHMAIHLPLHKAPKGSRPFGHEFKCLAERSKAAEEFEELLDQYWSLAFREGKTGESQGSKANEVLSALRNNRHTARAEALREAAEFAFALTARCNFQTVEHYKLANTIQAELRAMADGEGK